jgi:hypothetical protein
MEQGLHFLAKRGAIMKFCRCVVDGRILAHLGSFQSGKLTKLIESFFLFTEP